MTSPINPFPSDEALLDAAIADALGTTGADEQAALVKRLDTAGPADLQAVRGLRDVVARMAAASPYMHPPAGLRDRIVEATAPASFNMEEYRRKSVEPLPWYFRWGFVAAVLFLTAGAYYNISLRQQLQVASNHLQVMQAQSEKQAVALKMAFDPNVQQTPVVAAAADGQKKLIGKLLTDPASKKQILVMPATVLPPDSRVALTFEHDGQSEKIVADAVGGPNSNSFADVHLNNPTPDNGPIGVRVTSMGRGQ